VFTIVAPVRLFTEEFRRDVPKGAREGKEPRKSRRISDSAVTLFNWLRQAHTFRKKTSLHITVEHICPERTWNWVAPRLCVPTRPRARRRRSLQRLRGKGLLEADWPCEPRGADL